MRLYAGKKETLLKNANFEMVSSGLTKAMR